MFNFVRRNSGGHPRTSNAASQLLQMWRLPPLSRIGPEQFTDLFRITPVATLGQIVNATIVALALFPAKGAIARLLLMGKRAAKNRLRSEARISASLR